MTDSERIARLEELFEQMCETQIKAIDQFGRAGSGEATKLKLTDIVESLTRRPKPPTNGMLPQNSPKT